MNKKGLLIYLAAVAFCLGGCKAAEEKNVVAPTIEVTSKADANTEEQNADATKTEEMSIAPEADKEAKPEDPDVPVTTHYPTTVMSSWGFDVTEAVIGMPEDYKEPDYLIYVNKDHPISSDTYVGEMVPLSQNYNGELQQYTDDLVVLERKAAYAAVMMLNKVNELYPDTVVFPDSGYRSVAYQQEILERYIRMEGEAAARKRVATPGTSNHHTGLAMDIAMWKDGKYVDDVDDTDGPIVWLHTHAHEYGFFLEFPKGHSFKYEPWHFRYVGEEYATEIYNSGKLFTEWLADRS